MISSQFPHTEEGVKLMAEYLQSQILEQSPEKYLYNDAFFPVIFLAGAPGAGKTEWIESFPDIDNYVILDTDLYRSLFLGYTGSNASIYHQFASRVMDRMYTFCMKHGFNMIVDGTFSNEKKAEENIAQCKKRGIPFSVVLVIQDPIISYLYTKKREQEKQRNVPTDVFVRKYYQSIEVSRKVYARHPDMLFFITKKLKGNPKFSDIQVKHIEQFDKLTQNGYNTEELSQIIERMHAECNKNPGFINKILGLLQRNN